MVDPVFGLNVILQVEKIYSGTAKAKNITGVSLHSFETPANSLVDPTESISMQTANHQVRARIRRFNLDGPHIQ